MTTLLHVRATRCHARGRDARPAGEARPRAITTRTLPLAFVLLVACCVPGHAADSGARSTPRLSLTSARVEPAPTRAGPYTLNGRFAAAESEGELREGGTFVLIGRFAKGSASCAVGTIFLNGFETP